VLGPTTALLDAFKAANQVAAGAVQGIAELITRPGLINVDFADVRTVMSETGMAMMGSGVATGETRAACRGRGRRVFAAARGRQSVRRQCILVNVTAGLDLAIGEFEEVGRIIKDFASENATVVVGTVIDPEMTSEIRVTVVATGLGRQPAAVRSAVPPLREAVHHGREAPRIYPVRREMMAAPDYIKLEKPTFQRQRAVGDGLRVDGGAAEELLDIPTFLRRQPTEWHRSATGTRTPPPRPCGTVTPWLASARSATASAPPASGCIPAARC